MSAQSSMKPLATEAVLVAAWQQHWTWTLGLYLSLLVRDLRFVHGLRLLLQDLLRSSFHFAGPSLGGPRPGLRFFLC